MTRKQQLPYKEVGTRLGTARKLLGLTQKEFAEKSGIPYGSVSAYERGVNLPKLEAVEKLKTAGINMRFVLDNVETPLLQQDTSLSWGQRKDAHSYSLRETTKPYGLHRGEPIADNPSAFLENRKKAYNEVETILARISFKPTHKLLVSTMAELIDHQEITVRAAELLLAIFKDQQTQSK